MALTGHTATVVGTQTRGSAVGTRKQWTPPSDLSIAAGVDAIVAEIFVPDALSLHFQWDIKNTGADGIEKATVLVSQDGISFEEAWSKDYDPDAAPAAIGNIHNFISANGWDFDYVQVKFTSKTGGGGSEVRCNITDSIFTAGSLQFFDPSAGAAGGDVVADFNDRQSHVLAEGEIFNAAVAIAPATTSVITLGDVPKTFDMLLTAVLTGWGSLATITIVPEVYLNGAWRGVAKAEINPVTLEVEWEAGFKALVKNITGNFDIVLSLPQVIGERVRLKVNGDVADGTLVLYLIAKVPY